jgi:hypothetical protein
VSSETTSNRCPTLRVSGLGGAWISALQPVEMDRAAPLKTYDPPQPVLKASPGLFAPHPTQIELMSVARTRALRWRRRTVAFPASSARAGWSVFAPGNNTYNTVARHGPR